MFKYLLIILMYFIVGCAHQKFSIRQPNSDQSTKAAGDLYSGLWAEYGSNERRYAGELMQRWLDQAVEAAPKPDAEMSELEKTSLLKDIQLTRNVMQMTIDYMKSSQMCPAAQKVRLFRGMRDDQLLKRNGKSLSVWSTYTYRFIVEGKAIPANRQEFNKEDPFEDLNYKTLKNKYSFGDNTQVDFRWPNLTEAHSGVESNVSSLISTSLEASISQDFARPKLVVLDVCPERAYAIYSAGAATFPEAEVYLPLFVFPEEVVAVVDVPVNNPFYKVDPKLSLPPNKITRALRRSFFGNDLPYDVQYVTNISGFVTQSDTGTPDIYPYLGGSHLAEIYQLIHDRYKNNIQLQTWRDQTVAQITSFKPNPETCQYAYDSFVKSETFKMGSQPQLSYTFLENQKIKMAKFDLAEYQKAKAWEAEIMAKINQGVAEADVDKIQEAYDNSQIYFDNFSMYHFVNDKLYVGYLEKCKNK